MYRISRRQSGGYQNQQWSQIIAHYQIQVKLQHKKLRQMQQLHKHKVQQLEHKIRQQTAQRQQINTKITTTNQPLQLKIQQRRRQIQLLTMKLHQLKKQPQTNKYTTIDQQLILTPIPQIQIQQKQKQLRQLQNDLIQAQNIFQGKYVIQHKLINQYQMELKMNKKLQLQIDQMRNKDDKLLEIKRNQRVMVVSQYKRMVEKVGREIQLLRENIQQVERENKIYSMKNSYDNREKNIHPDDLLILNVSKRQHQQHNLHRIFNQQQSKSQLISFNINYNINPSDKIKLQTLQIQNLQQKLSSLIEANQQLLTLKSQKQSQLIKIKCLNEQKENQQMEVRLRKGMEMSGLGQMNREEDKLTQKDLKRDSFQSHKTLRQRQQISSQPQQSQGLLESVIKFFKKFNNQQTQPKQKQPIQTQNISLPINKPITGRDTLASSAIINKQSPSRLQFLQRQQSSFINSTPQQNKYNMFGLQQIYKKNTPKTQPHQTSL